MQNDRERGDAPHNVETLKPLARLSHFCEYGGRAQPEVGVTPHCSILTVCKVMVLSSAPSGIIGPWHAGAASIDGGCQKRARNGRIQ